MDLPLTVFGHEIQGNEFSSDPAVPLIHASLVFVPVGDSDCDRRIPNDGHNLGSGIC